MQKAKRKKNSAKKAHVKVRDLALKAPKAGMLKGGVRDPASGLPTGQR
jgi:hypothetical protein